MLALKKNPTTRVPFAEVKDRTFVDVIAGYRPDHLPARLSHEADLIRLGLIGVKGYVRPDPSSGVKLVKASIPSHLRLHKTSSNSLDFQDVLETVWIIVQENDGQPVMSVRPSYGWRVENSDFRNGLITVTVFHPSGMQDDMTLKFNEHHGFPNYQHRLKEFDKEVEEMYGQLKYPANWRDLGIPMAPS